MTLAQLAVELRRRALLVPEAPGEQFEETVAVLGALAHSGTMAEADTVRKILVALTHTDHESDLRTSALDSLSPETLRRFEALVIALLDGWYTTAKLRTALRPALLRSVK